MQQRVDVAHKDLEEIDKFYFQPSQFRQDHFQAMRQKLPKLSSQAMKLFGVQTNELYDLDRRQNVEAFRDLPEFQEYLRLKQAHLFAEEQAAFEEQGPQA